MEKVQEKIKLLDNKVKDTQYPREQIDGYKKTVFRKKIIKMNFKFNR